MQQRKSYCMTRQRTPVSPTKGISSGFVLYRFTVSSEGAMQATLARNGRVGCPAGRGLSSIDGAAWKMLLLLRLRLRLTGLQRLLLGVVFLG